MKKSLIALAVLAASGAAMAQSSVTLYGIADVWFGSVKDTNGATGNSLRQTKLDSGGVDTSRFGLKGSEDLGGGLKANFQLEQGFGLDNGVAGNVTNFVTPTGAATTQAFDRQAWVGFSGGFGAVQLGKSWSAFDDVNGTSDAVFDSALSPATHVFRSTGYTDRPVNGLKYITPSFGGFAGAISYSLGENKTATTSADSITAVNLTYGAGPLAVQLGYQVETDKATAGASDAKFTRLGGSYDFGVAKALASYGHVSNVGNVSGFDAKEYQVGVDVPVGTALTLSASYAKSDDSNVGFEESRKGYGIGAKYTLSKRTFVYGGYTANKFTNNGTGDDKLDILAIGVNHKF